MKKNIIIPASNRIYLVAFIEGENVVAERIYFYRLFEEIENEYEYMCAIRENIDSILNLKIGDRFNMHFNRDNGDSFGSIKRVQ